MGNLMYVSSNVTLLFIYLIKYSL